MKVCVQWYSESKKKTNLKEDKLLSIISTSFFCSMKKHRLSYHHPKGTMKTTQPAIFSSKSEPVMNNLLHTQCSATKSSLHQICNSFWEQRLLKKTIYGQSLFWKYQSDILSKNRVTICSQFFVTAQLLVPFTTRQGAGWLPQAMLHRSPILPNSHALTQVFPILTL